MLYHIWFWFSGLTFVEWTFFRCYFLLFLVVDNNFRKNENIFKKNLKKIETIFELTFCANKGAYKITALILFSLNVNKETKIVHGKIEYKADAGQ